MAWEHLSINKPHLVYIILGGFTSIFMLCSLFIKEKLYIGEGTVATICGVIFGPHAANLIDPTTWGNTDQITLEFSRIVLVVQCFAVGVELPKSYMERHWKSVVFLLVPVMTFGWLITSVFIWWMIVPVTWLEALCIAACVTATDPVLASSVVGKGKFAKRVPKHLRDVLSAESGCNDGMAFPFIYLSVYLLRYDLGAREVIFHWTCYTILYECIFGAFYGFMIGYIGRHAIRKAEDVGLIDRESFLVFYFVLALFCAGSGSMLGMDDLLIGFSAGVGFSNDGWFTEKTEESHVSNVIDLLLNLAYFVYFGTIIPWDQYNAPEIGLVPWRLVVIGIFVILFRRIPIMLALKPIIPDVKTWREALFAGHFGPIGVGAIFAAILARAELETESTDPLAVLPPPGTTDYELILLVWPVVTFLVICSILVHGSSIAVFTLGKRINTLTLTLSYTQDNESGPSWMNRLPRISSQSRSMSKLETSSFDSTEKLELPPGTSLPKNFLRQQKEEDNPSRSSSLKPTRRRKKWDSGMGPGGPVSRSAITPARRSEPTLVQQESGSETLNEKSQDPSPHGRRVSDGKERLATGSPTSSPERDAIEMGEERKARGRRQRSFSPGRQADVEAFEEGHDLIIEDEEGNVLQQVNTGGKTDAEKAEIIEQARNRLRKDTSGHYAKHKHEAHDEKTAGEEMEDEIEQAVQPAEHPQRGFRKQLDAWRGWGRSKPGEDIEAEAGSSSHRKKPERKRGPAHAFQFGNTVIVEDEDGEVIKTYTLPPSEGQEGGRRITYNTADMRKGLQRMGTWVGLKPGEATNPAEGAAKSVPTEREGGDGQALEEEEVGREDSEAGRGSTTHQKQLKMIDKSARRDEQEDDDPLLRMTISRQDRYGLTGLQKEKKGTGPGGIDLGGGRRLSTMDFMRHLQQLDPKSRIETVKESDAPEHLKREVKRDAVEEKERTGRKRAATVPSKSGSSRPVGERTDTMIERQAKQIKRPDGERKADTDYFNQAPRKERDSEEAMSPGTTRDQVHQSKEMVRPEAVRSDTVDTVGSNGSAEEEEVPTYDLATTIERHGLRMGGTAAEERRKRLATIRSNDEEDQEDETQQRETAAEKRRRLAALGLGSQHRDDSSESSSEENEGPTTERGREMPMKEEDVVKSGSQRPRVQWGGDIGREREKGEEGSDSKPLKKGTRKARGMFKNRKTEEG